MTYGRSPGRPSNPKASREDGMSDAGLRLVARSAPGSVRLPVHQLPLRCVLQAGGVNGAISTAPGSAREPMSVRASGC